jgi:hypothetical protein
MFPEFPVSSLDHCFDLAEHLALRSALLLFLLRALYLVVEREWRRK